MQIVQKMVVHIFGKNVMSKLRVYEWYKHFRGPWRHWIKCPTTSTTKENMENFKDIMLTESL